MKNMILAAILMTGMTSFAQVKSTKTEKSGEDNRIEKISPEQRNSLRVKELALKLDLTAQQQQEFTKLFAEDAAKRTEMKKQFKEKRSEAKKMTAEERFALKNKMLDEKIARKAKVRSILNADQYAKWESLQDHKSRKGPKSGKFKQHRQKNR